MRVSVHRPISSFAVFLLAAALLQAVPFLAGAARAFDGVRLSQIDTPGGLSPRQASLEEKRHILDGPVNPSEYVLGPGDALQVEAWGRVRFQVRLEVDAEGRVFIPDFGSLSVAGKTLEEVRSAVSSAVLSSLRGAEVEVRLVALREFKVFVSGDVESPGSYVASGATRVSEILAVAKSDTLGPRLRETSSCRNIEIRHRNGSAERADLSLFYNLGDVSHNPHLQDGDVIYVPKIRHCFSISGVMFPGTYELVEGETLAQVLRLVGGVVPEASLEKGEIRHFVDSQTTESEFFDLAAVTEGRSDLEIRKGDRVYVRTPAHYLEHYQVLLTGEVLFPGYYAINRREDRLSDVVMRAGGFTPEADLSAARIIRPHSLSSGEAGRVEIDFSRLFNDNRTEEDLLLESGDIIEVPKRIGYVQVTGEVKKPGYVPYVPGKSAGHYLREAGGLTSKAAGGKIQVRRYATGQSVSRSEAGVLRPNDTVLVPARPEGARWALFKDTVSLLAQIATIYLIVDQATKK
ncbi:MAG: SLBB domain-containing protein [Candidatus Eisenbacteria bacterium]